VYERTRILGSEAFSLGSGANVLENHSASILMYEMTLVS
jgi:hypothetical protein